MYSSGCTKGVWWSAWRWMHSALRRNRHTDVDGYFSLARQGSGARALAVFGVAECSTTYFQGTSGPLAFVSVECDLQTFADLDALAGPIYPDTPSDEDLGPRLDRSIDRILIPRGTALCGVSILISIVALDQRRKGWLVTTNVIRHKQSSCDGGCRGVFK